MRGNAATEVNLPGTLLPYQETPIYARTNGYVKRLARGHRRQSRERRIAGEIETPEVDRELKQAVANLAQVRAHWNWTARPPSAGRRFSPAGRIQQEVDEKVGAYQARKADYAAAEPTCSAWRK